MTRAIVVEQLGKRYKIGRPTPPAQNWRGAVLGGLKAHWGRLKMLSAGGEDDEFIWALRDVSFEVEPGEVLGLIGRNGSGKSTLLKILSRIVTPTEGRAEIRGRVGSLLEVGTGFHPELTGRENIFLNGAVLGMPRSTIRKVFDEIVAFAEIDKFLDTPVKRYSSGMYVRLAFAVAAHLDPNILILDEVLAVGDAAFQEKCLNRVAEVAHDGRTVLFVSHNMSSVTALCTRAILLERGRIAATGRPAEVVATYMKVEDVSPDELVYARDDAKAAQILRIRLRSPEAATTRVFHQHDTIQLEMDYEVRRPLKGLVGGGYIQTSAGVRVLSVCEADSQPELNSRVRQPGAYTAVCELPAGLLNIGQYRLTLGLANGVPSSTVHDVREHATSFEVLRSEHTPYCNMADGDGVVRPYIPWTTTAGPSLVDGESARLTTARARTLGAP